MVGRSKILTVSYGTFSYTFEEFDNSLNTLRTIVEYFRSLTSNDPYFGAQPSTTKADMLTKIAKGEILRLVEIHKDESGIILHIAVPIDRSADTTGTAQDANTRTKIEATRNSAKAIHKARTKAKIAAKAANENIEPNEVTKVDIATKTEDNAKSEGTKRNTAGHRAEAEFETTFAGGMTSSIVGSSNTTSTAQIKKQMIQPILLCR
jgi:hypothetical protein